MSFLWWPTSYPRNAAEWFARLRVGKISKRVDARFKRWLGRDARHEPEYERQELVWELAQELEGDAEIAALLREAEQPQSMKAQAMQRTLPRSLPSWQGWDAVGAVAGTLLVAIVAIWFWSGRSEPGQLYVTGVGELRTVILPDESQVTLNTATRLRVAFTRSVRTVTLEQGEATFVVAHDRAHPFEVVAAGGKARALGTQFNVFARPSGVTVSVLEGTVEVTPAVAKVKAETSLQHAVLSAGQEVGYSAGKLTPVKNGDVDRINAWHTRHITFYDVTLESAIAEFNRYSRIPLVLGDRSLAARHVTGVFRIGETEALLSALQEAFGVRAVRDAKSIVLWPATAVPPTPDFLTTHDIERSVH